MEKQNKKCSSDKHEQIATSYCDICKIYMCNKCTNFHSELFGSHQLTNLNKNINEIFTGICKEKKHTNKLEYFCKTHNSLCCAACISKIESKGNGLHKNCNVCNIEEIKDEKKNKLKDNIQYLEKISKTLDQSIKELKIIFEKINMSKENLKIEIQKIFTEIRNALNEREDQLLLEVDNKFNNTFFNEEIIKQSEKIPNKMKISLEKGKLIENEWDENKNKLNSLINDCISIENNIKDINMINENINKYNSNSIIVDIKFNPEKGEVNKFIDTIKSFGKIDIKTKKKLNNSLGKLLKEKDIELLENWIKSDNNKINSIHFELCYDAKKNGDDKNNFHKFCDKIGPSLLVIKTQSNYIFGGYTKENWEIADNYSYKDDYTAFLFSLNNKERIKVKNSKRAIVNDKDYGPVFGYGNCYEICLFYPFLSNDIQIEDGGDYGDKNLILTGKKSRRPEEIELYKVLFD